LKFVLVSAGGALILTINLSEMKKRGKRMGTGALGSASYIASGSAIVVEMQTKPEAVAPVSGEENLAHPNTSPEILTAMHIHSLHACTVLPSCCPCSLQ
jgi:hypothetical protein